MGSKFVGAVGAASVVVGLIVSSGAQTGIAATPAVPHAISFSDVAEDAVIATKLLGVQTLIAEDGARAIKSARPLASRIERTDAAMTTLCTDIINDASAGARAAQQADHHGIDFADLSQVVADATKSVKAKLAQLTRQEKISVVEMFEMQMAMNHLSQLSEMSTSVMSAANSSIASMARNVKS